MATNTRPSHKLLKHTSKSFGESVLRAMLVSAEGENGEPRKVTQQELAERSGVGRSTIAKYSAMKADENLVANPDLDTICRLADALNVSPAFLLMSPEDWSHMAQAAMFLSTAVNDGKVNEIAEDIAESGGGNAIAMSLVGLKLATRFGVYNKCRASFDKSGSIGAEIDARNRKIKGAILATSALPPVGQLNKGHVVPLLSMCAIMGAYPKTF